MLPTQAHGSAGFGQVRRWLHLTAALAVASAVVLGSGWAQATTWVYAQESTALTYLRGTQTPPATWTDTSYSEGTGWTPSAAGFGIGYGDGDDNTVLADMAGSYLTVYVRAHFNVGAELGSIQHLELEATFDDGFVAYLNGTEIGRSNVPAGALQHDDAASSGHENTDGTESFVISPSLLVAGDNVLAIEVHNASLGSSDLSFIPRLFAWDTPPTDADITRGPYLQQLGRRGVLVVWETDAAVASTVEYGPTDALGLTAEDTAAKTHHVISLEGLDPSTSYYYQIQSARTPSVLSQFRTEVDQADPYRVAVYGDTRSGHDDHAAVINALAPHEPAIGFLTGDLVADGDVASLWDIFFDREAPLLRSMALSPVLGNHEASGSLYVDAFELPANTASPERYYSVRYAGSLGVAINLYGDAYDAGSDQYTWLEQTLSDAAADREIRHVWAFLHHSPYSSGSHGSSTSVRSELSPLFEQYGVELVFAGHDHHYERSVVNDVTYVVTGGGGAPLYAVSGDTWTVESESVHHYILLDVEGPRLEYTAYRLDSSVLDGPVIFGTEDAGECSQPSDCSSLEEATCESDETGQWQCVYGGCIYNCHYEPPEEPDAGAGASGGSGTGGIGGSGASGAGDPGVSNAEPGDDSGCGCRMGPAASAFAWAWLAVGLVGLGLRRRRRGRATRH